jgi:hypothetical protein
VKSGEGPREAMRRQAFGLILRLAGNKLGYEKENVVIACLKVSFTPVV